MIPLCETVTPLVAVGGVIVIAGVVVIMVQRGTTAVAEADGDRYETEA